MAKSAKKTAKSLAKKVKKTAQKTAKKAKSAVTPKAKTEPQKEAPDSTQSLTTLRDQIEEMFDHYFKEWPRWPRLSESWDLDTSFGPAGFQHAPTVDMSESDDGYTVTAELPGLDENDLDVSLVGDVLTIKGEKREEKEEKEKEFHLKERRYGQFRRSFKLPDDVNSNKISADFQQGVLTVDLPKATGSKKRARRIKVGDA